MHLLTRTMPRSHPTEPGSRTLSGCPAVKDVARAETCPLDRARSHCIVIEAAAARVLPPENSSPEVAAHPEPSEFSNLKKNLET